jgi:cell division protein ZapA (FtsZ GTPase activity inhibitor)
MPTITIDGKQYDIETMSDKAKAQLASIQFVDRKISELKAEVAAFQTARNGYARALSELLDKTETEQ